MWGQKKMRKLSLINSFSVVFVGARLKSLLQRLVLLQKLKEIWLVGADRKVSQDSLLKKVWTSHFGFLWGLSFTLTPGSHWIRKCLKAEALSWLEWLRLARNLQRLFNICTSHERIEFNKTKYKFFVGIYIVVGIQKQYETHMNQRLLGKTRR